MNLPEPFGRYTLMERIGVGGMAEVFRARSRATHGVEKMVVIKRILREHSDDPDFVAMFVDEARISVRLQHPNIVQLYEFGQANDHYYMAMEFIEGVSLAALLRALAERGEVLPPALTVYLTTEICRGLWHAHQLQDPAGRPLQVVHRDICPANILLSFTGEVKVADFGIARSALSLHTTTASGPKGHTAYMSPEQVQGLPLDQRSDLFSVGILTHELLAGRRLFGPGRPEEVYPRILRAEVVPPSSFHRAVPAGVDAAVLAALALDPAARPPDARALRDRLIEALPDFDPDHQRDALATTLQTLFAERRAALRKQVAEEETASLTLGPAAPPPPRRRWGVLLGLGGALAALALGVTPLLRAPAETDPVATGTIEVVLTGPGTVYINGAPTSGAQVVPAEQAVRIEVRTEGYLPFTDTIAVAAGERVRIPVQLQPAPPSAVANTTNSTTISLTTGPTPAPSPRATVSPPPPTEPLSAETTRAPAAEAALKTAPEAAPLPPETAVSAPATAPTPAPAAPPADLDAGTLQLYVVNGWAIIRVDGKKIRQTTGSIRLDLPAGAHTIHVEQPSTGRSYVHTVQITGGQATPLTIELD